MLAGSFAVRLALKRDGSVVVWGCSSPHGGECAVSPAATSGVTAIAAGSAHGLASGETAA